jgi:thioredoxin-dependent peroxiredoxin
MRFMFVISMLCMAAASLAAMQTQAPSAPTGPELKVGDQAPDFTLQASDGKTYKLSDFRGKQAVVLAWFPKAYTSGCTIECKSLAEHGDMIRKYDVTYFMASVDPLADNKGFAEQQHADFPLLSDPTKETAAAYGVLTNPNGVARRWTFYIGKDGRILAIDKAVKPATSAEDMAAKLGELKVDAARGTQP